MCCLTRVQLLLPFTAASLTAPLVVKIPPTKDAPGGGEEAFGNTQPNWICFSARPSNSREIRLMT